MRGWKAFAVQIALTTTGLAIVAYEVITSTHEVGIYAYIAFVASIVVFGASP